MTGRVSRLPTVVSFHPEAGLIIPAFGLFEVGIRLEIAALRGLVVATVANYAIRAVVHKERVRLILITRRR